MGMSIDVLELFDKHHFGSGCYNCGGAIDAFGRCNCNAYAYDIAVEDITEEELQEHCDSLMKGEKNEH